MHNVLLHMLLMELKHRLIKHKWIIPGKYIFPVIIWEVSDWAHHGKWGYEK